MVYKGYLIKPGTLRLKYCEKTAEGGIHDPKTGQLLALCETKRLAKQHIDDRTARGLRVGVYQSGVQEVAEDA